MTTNNDTNRLQDFRLSLARLSLGEQKSIFNVLPATFKAALWQDRLKEGIKMISDEHQEGFLLDVLINVTPEAYSDPETTLNCQQKLIDAAEKAQEVFDDPDWYGRLITTLGDGPYPSTAVVKTTGLAKCTCSSAFSGGIRGSNDCAALTECKAGGCIPSTRGCGAIWLYSCDVLCTGEFATPS